MVETLRFVDLIGRECRARRTVVTVDARGELYRAGYAPVVVLSEAVPERALRQLDAVGIRFPRAMEIHRQVLQAMGVPLDRMEPLGGLALSTADEAEQIAARFSGKGTRILVVPSPFHVKRARLIISRASEGRDISLAVVGMPHQGFPDARWTSQGAAREVLLEWAGIVWYLTGGGFRASAS